MQLVGSMLVYVLQITTVHDSLKIVRFKCIHHAKLYINVLQNNVTYLGEIPYNINLADMKSAEFYH